MRTRPMLHEAENEAEAKTYEAEATKFGIEAVYWPRGLNIPAYSLKRLQLNKKTYICIAPHSKELTAEALRCGSHSFHTANTPHLHLPVGFHQRAPPVVIAAI